MADPRDSVTRVAPAATTPWSTAAQLCGIPRSHWWMQSHRPAEAPQTGRWRLPEQGRRSACRSPGVVRARECIPDRILRSGCVQTQCDASDQQKNKVAAESDEGEGSR